MFVRLRIMAHDALKNYMMSDHPPLYDDTTQLIYDIIKTAETDPAFAMAFDNECARAFDGETSNGYDDLVQLFDCLDDTPEELEKFLKYHKIIKED